MADPLNQPINPASVDFLRQLDAVEPGVWGTPCAIVLSDGHAIEHALAWENAHYSDAGEWTHPDRVIYLTESPARMPAKFARLIYNAGESGMGYHIYVVRLSDGASFVHVAANLAIDLVSLPLGYTQKDIMGIDPHEGRQRSRDEGYRSLSDLPWASVEFVRPRGDG